MKSEQPKGFRLHNHNVDRVAKHDKGNRNGFINACIDFYFNAQNIAKANRNMTAEQLVKEAMK